MNNLASDSSKCNKSADVNVSRDAQAHVGFLTHESFWRDVGAVFTTDGCAEEDKIGILRRAGNGKFEICLWASPKAMRLFIGQLDCGDIIDTTLSFRNEFVSQTTVCHGGTVKLAGTTGRADLCRLPSEGCRILF